MTTGLRLLLLLRIFLWLQVFGCFLFFCQGEEINIETLVNTLKFDNPDGGAWKQGWNVQYDPHIMETGEKLRSHLVLFSHCDPGWLMTPEQYYEQKTRGILTTIATELANNGHLRFIWSEISYFSMWWNEISAEMKEKTKKLIQSGQLEIATGGWVMNDEAAIHYDAIIHQLTTGHEWLRENGIPSKPKIGWSIDPFGHSSIQPYFYSLMGFSGMVISRVHYAVKKALALQSAMEFYWRPPWDTTEDYDIFTHMMPFYHYDFPHTCGPDPTVCSLYEFGRKVSTAWGHRITPISPDNLDAKSFALLDQYRKKSTLYRTKHVLAPFGDDFTYITSSELLTITNSLTQIFDYINDHKKWNAIAEFSNLTDYFDSARQTPRSKFPLVQGDFFSYADRNQDYWTGFYTSRPFYKGFDRIVQSTLRAAEILYTLVMSKIDFNFNHSPMLKEIYGQLKDARYQHSIFQHHDGISGTSKDHVVKDYGNKLQRSWWDCKNAIKKLLPLLPGAKDNFELSIPDLQPSAPFSIPSAYPLNFKSDKSIKSILFYNSLSHERQQLVELMVNSPLIRIYDFQQNVIPYQIQPVFEDEQMSSNKFLVTFPISVPAFGYSIYSVAEAPETPSDSIPSLTVINSPNIASFLGKPVQSLTTSESFKLKNDNLEVLVNSETGLLQSIRVGDKQVELREEFLKYFAPDSGAYLFIPKEQAKPIHCRSSIVISKGSMVQEVRSSCVVDNTKIISNIRVFSHGDQNFIQVKRYVDVKDVGEWIVRYSSSVDSKKTFYTDLNSFHMQKRTRRDDLCTQHNFYPSTSLVFLQDSSARLSFHTTQSLSVGSTEDGSIEFILDRRLSSDDNRGLGQAVMDNVPFELTFLITVETLTDGESSSQPSLSAQWLRLLLDNPVHMAVAAKEDLPSTFPFQFGAIQNIPKDVHFISLKVRNPSESRDILWQFTRFPTDTTIDQNSDSATGTFALDELLTTLGVTKMQEYSLTFLHFLNDLDPETQFEMKPYETKAVILQLAPRSHQNLKDRKPHTSTPTEVDLVKLQKENIKLKEQLRLAEKKSCDVAIQSNRYLLATFFFGILLIAALVTLQKRVRYFTVFGVLLFIGLNIILNYIFLLPKIE